MDPLFRGFAGSENEIEVGNRRISILSNQNFVARPRFENNFVVPTCRDFRYLEPNPNPTPNNVVPCSTVSEEDSTLNSGIPRSSDCHEDEYAEDCDFSDTVLGYISEMLMEEDMEDKTCMLQDSLELQAAEKSLYEVIGKKYPPSPEGQNPDDATEGLVDSPDSNIQVRDLYRESQSVWQFNKGVEEARKFLPNNNDFFVNLELNGVLPRVPGIGTTEAEVKVERKEKDNIEYSPSGSRGRKNPHRDDVDLEEEEERSRKQAAGYTESILRSEMFDDVLLCCMDRPDSPMSTLRDSLQNGVSKSVQQNGQAKGSNGGKGRGKKNGKKEVVDLRALLVSCAQAVAADDRRSANELLKQIKQHSSPFGDGNQRLAQCFADGLEARLAGTGSQIYKGLTSKRTSTSDTLKAYKLYIAACPFRKLSHFFSNRTIRNVTRNAMRLHIIDFGILYGFQWPTLIHRLSTRPGGPPKLRITGIDFPQPGFRPAERVQETGRRLADYAKTFNVPFEFNAIAKKWETIQLEELKINEDEVLVVNSIYRFQNLLDETVAVDSSRNIVLNMIRKINPDIFIHGLVNGAYNAPFFVTRFREALFHFSAMFDMLETIVPREYVERMLIEREIFGREALNVVACEGWERIERPETYKQWQVRIMRAGFRQLPVDQEIMEKATDKVRTIYHKDFLIDKDGGWFLQGWKGRIIYALSIWQPSWNS